ncbi:hypothetical protein CKK33_11470 [Mucilaginibacter sp. MD40]|uniref:hypothetical protein n=1 Tax=Mucilaginibacter sp. MD40 TaxID=2029590 RepID=UPI000BACC662|nr:hypothetical protein [Mucilaginibacter sp. MD40]PAW94080.1 hypothetical protein CKK33_11470 [Mucilaginibacter sp. MD40]
MAKNFRYTFNNISDWPWLKIVLIGGFSLWLINKIASSSTWVGDFIRRIISPTVTEVVEHQQQVFDIKYKNVTNSTWTPDKIRSDARRLAYEFNTYKGSWGVERIFYRLDDTAFNIVKNYTNKTLKKALDEAYTTFATDGRTLDTDLMKFISSDGVKYLRTKGIL